MGIRYKKKTLAKELKKIYHNVEVSDDYETIKIPIYNTVYGIEIKGLHIIHANKSVPIAILDSATMKDALAWVKGAILRIFKRIEEEILELAYKSIDYGIEWTESPKEILTRIRTKTVREEYLVIWEL